MSAWSCGIVVASTSMTATRVEVGWAAYAIGAEATTTPSKRARRVARTRERRTRVRIAGPPRDRVDRARQGRLGVHVHQTPRVKPSAPDPTPLPRRDRATIMRTGERGV